MKPSRMNKMEYIKLTARPNTYYDVGTEVFDYDGKRFTKGEWELWLESGIVCVRGYVNGYTDGETSTIDEFDVEYGVGPGVIDEEYGDRLKSTIKMMGYKDVK